MKEKLFALRNDVQAGGSQGTAALLQILDILIGDAPAAAPAPAAPVDAPVQPAGDAAPVQ